MLKIKDDWEFTAFEIYNYNKLGKLDHLIEFIKKNHTNFEGDIFEAGVFRGTSLLAIAMILKEIGSDKKIYGFDSFSGFPPIFHEKDGLLEFNKMAKEKKISEEHLAAVNENVNWRKKLSTQLASSEISTLSTSRDFSSTSLDLLKCKINILELDNIVLIDGNFSETMSSNRPAPKKIFAGIIDCDLYQSYIETCNFVWPRLENGAMIYLDEYYSLKFPGARRATDEFISDKPGCLEMSPHRSGDFERWHLIKKNQH